MDNYIIPSEIKKLVEHMGLDHKGMAEAVGVSNGQVVRKWIDGINKPTGARREKLIKLKHKHLIGASKPAKKIPVQPILRPALQYNIEHDMTCAADFVTALKESSKTVQKFVRVALEAEWGES